MSNDEKKRPDLHHSQGVAISEVLSGVDPEMVEKEEEEEAHSALCVVSVLDKLEAHLSPRAKEVLARKRHSTSPEMFIFARVYPNGVTDADYEDFAKRFNVVCEKLNGQFYPHRDDDIEFGSRPSLEATLAPPIGVPLAPHPRMLLTIYVFIYDLPFWTWQDVNGQQVNTFDVEAARKWLIERTGFYFVREGELPNDEVQS